MATEKQIAANRANGAKGGPKTEEGKNRSKYNALRHGLACKTVVVLRNENADEFRQLHQQIHESIHPPSGLEAVMVQKLANAYWKGQRKDQAEAGLLLMQILEERKSIKDEGDKVGKSVDNITPGEFLGLSFFRRGNALEKFLRYATAIDREFNKTMDQLLRVIKLRNTLVRPEESTEAQEPVAEPGFQTVAKVPQPINEPAESAASEEIGSVQHTQHLPSSPAQAPRESHPSGPQVASQRFQEVPSTR